MPPDALSDAKCRLDEAYALLDSLIDLLMDDLSLRRPAVIAGEHVRIAQDALAQVEELLRIRQHEKAE